MHAHNTCTKISIKSNVSVWNLVAFGEGRGNTFSLFRYAVVILLKLRLGRNVGVDGCACVEAIA